MKTNLGMILILGAVLSGTAVQSVLADDVTEVSALIKCHEGKFDAMNAVSQLTKEISAENDTVCGWSGIGAYPDGHMDGHLVVVHKPFTVSAPSFVQVKSTTWACVTVQKQ